MGVLSESMPMGNGIIGSLSLFNQKAKINLHYYITNMKILRTLQQQQLSHLSQVFGVGYMNQQRITSNRAYGSAFSTHFYRAIYLH